MQPVQLALREPRGESRHDSRLGATLRVAVKRRAAPFRRVLLGTSLAWFALASSAAFAAGVANPDATPSDAPEADLNIQTQPAGQWTGVWTRSTLLGDMGGVRSWLGKYGVTLQATEVSEYLDNVAV
jgi:porin